MNETELLDSLHDAQILAIKQDGRRVIIEINHSSSNLHFPFSSEGERGRRVVGAKASTFDFRGVMRYNWARKRQQANKRQHRRWRR